VVAGTVAQHLGRASWIVPADACAPSWNWSFNQSGPISVAVSAMVRPVRPLAFGEANDRHRRQPREDQHVASRELYLPALVAPRVET
jgi:hypothetical protein